MYTEIFAAYAGSCLFSSEKHVMSCSLILNTQVLREFLTLGPHISIWVELEKDILKLWHYIIKRANLIFIYSQFHGCLSFIAYLHFKIFCYEMQNWNFRLEMIFLQSIPWHIFYPLWNIGSTTGDNCHHPSCQIWYQWEFCWDMQCVL